VNELRRISIHPDILVCRSTEPLTRDIRDKIALFADVDPEAVVSAIDVPDVCSVPKSSRTRASIVWSAARVSATIPISASGTSCSPG
jgi:CTP synthase (UTP-ammonia lyase)